MDSLSLDSVTDPSDFPIDSLQKLDSSLRCAICKEFFDGPVVLHCGHTFCSLCIRTVLPGKPECPTCRTTAKETHLTRNAMYEETVSAWSNARALILKLAKESVLPRPILPATRGNKRKLSHNSDKEHGPSKLSRRGSSKAHSSQYEEGSEEEPASSWKSCQHTAEGEVVPSSDPEEEELPSPTRTNPPIDCPLCSRPVPYNSINPHMDSGCKKYILTESSVAGSRAKPSSKATWGSILNGQGKKTTSGSSVKDCEIITEKVAKVSYDVLTFSALRKLLSEKGLSTQGDKHELEQRHKRWTAICNANLDRTERKTVSELRQQLKELEEARGRPGPKQVKDEKAWRRKNKEQFDKLIEVARPKGTGAEGKSASPLSPRPQPSASTTSSVPIATGSSSDVIEIN